MPNIGSLAASSVAATLKSSFPNIQLALVVGICGGIPIGPHGEEILLGDVIISEAVIQYDFGRLYPYEFRRKDTAEDNLGRQSPSVRAFVAKLKAEHILIMLKSGISDGVELLRQKSDLLKDPEPLRDNLFRSSYLHKHRPAMGCTECDQNETMICDIATHASCDVVGCDDSALVMRNRSQGAPDRRPEIHFVRYGSGNLVMKSGTDRDRMAAADSIIALEMAGAGVSEYLPTIIVKEVCYYANSHKSKGWQKHAAANAAACVKAMLLQWEPEDMTEPEPVLPKTSLLPYTTCANFVDRKEYSTRLQDFFQDWNGGPRRFILWGLGGVGKTQTALHFVTSQVPALQAFWVRAEKTENFLIDYRKILELLNKEVYQTIPQDEPRAAFEARLAELEKVVSQWILVLDNADDIDNFRKQSGNRLYVGEYLPRNGRIFITTRDSRFLGETAGGSNGPEVRSISMQEGELLLQASIPADLEDDADKHAVNNTSRLLDDLGHLPLAIAQAAANMRYLQIPLTEYVQLYREKRSRMELLSQPVHDP